MKQPLLRSVTPVIAGMLLIGAGALHAVDPITGRTGFIQYMPGELPVVLSAPHGGRLTPKEVANRPFGKLMRDGGTLELAQEIRLAMRRQFGKAPHLIVCQLARVKLDCNREIKEAAQGDPIAEQAWTEYHGYIREAERTVMGQYPRGLYLDIHGHAHDQERMELGYLLSKAELDWPDLRFNKPDVAERSSIRALQAFTKTPLSELLRGPQSLGGLMEQRGIPCMPSPSQSFEKDDLYFDGGYDTEEHGSIDGVGLDGIQVETPPIYRNDPEQRRVLARAISDALKTYFLKHYQIDLSKPPPATEAQ